MTIEKLPKIIQSSDQLQLCIDEIETYAKSLIRINQQRSGGSRINAQEEVISKSSLALLDMVPEAERSEAAIVEKLASDLREVLRNSYVVHITTAGLTPTGVKADITQWFRTNISPFILIAFHVSPDIAGGMLVRTMNQVYDFSFRTQLLVQSSKVVKVLENV
jgi:F0F1-type ATP synthase delta subunit